MPQTTPRFSIITPSRGDRPVALGLAIDSVRMAMEQAGLAPADVEMLVGFDGVKGERVRPDAFIRWFDFRPDKDYGNAIRNGLLRAARGQRILFLDDDASGDPEFIRDLDFGDRPEGTTVTHRIKLFNSSTTKIANNLTLSLIDVDFTFSMDEGATWVTGATITSLAPQGTSASILIKNTIPPPPQMLGPRAPRFEVTIGSWS